MSKMVYSLKDAGKKKVRIEDAGYGLELHTMRNGFQWTGFGVDDMLLKMMRDAISEYFEKTDNQKLEPTETTGG